MQQKSTPFKTRLRCRIYCLLRSLPAPFLLTQLCEQNSPVLADRTPTARAFQVGRRHAATARAAQKGAQLGEHKPQHGLDRFSWHWKLLYWPNCYLLATSLCICGTSFSPLLHGVSPTQFCTPLFCMQAAGKASDGCCMSPLKLSDVPSILRLLQIASVPQAAFPFGRCCCTSSSRSTTFTGIKGRRLRLTKAHMTSRHSGNR